MLAHEGPSKSPIQITVVRQDNVRRGHSSVGVAQCGTQSSVSAKKVRLRMFCAPLLDMLDHGELLQVPFQEMIVRQDDVWRAHSSIGTAESRFYSTSVKEGRK